MSSKNMKISQNSSLITSQQVYFFLFGNTPQLSFKELQSLVPEAELVLSNLGQVSLQSDGVARDLFAKLGGSVKLIKLHRKIDQIANDEYDEEINNQIAQFLNENKDEGKLTFGLGIIGQTEANITETRIKKALKNNFSVSSRFIEHIKTGLSASVLLHQEVTEVMVISLDGELFLGETLVVQDIDDWTNRDRGKPYADRKKGMLPPKVARMMVNIAVGDDKKTIFDPFCGTGTVLAEGLMRGQNVLGSDADGQATEGAEKNLAWLCDQYNLPPNYQVFLSDATKVSSMHDFSKDKVETIVTEPFLGKPKPQSKQLSNIFKGLEKMYLGAFKDWTKILVDGAKVVIIFPQVEIYNRVHDLSKLIDKLALLGYTTVSEPVTYARTGAITKRQIYIFEFKK